MAQELKKHKIEVECILDAAIGYVMETIDLVLVGAEGVLASGGIVNKVRVHFLRCLLLQSLDICM